MADDFNMAPRTLNIETLVPTVFSIGPTPTARYRLIYGLTTLCIG